MLRLVFMFFMSLLWAGMSEEKVREAAELFNTLTEQGYRALLVPDCNIGNRNIFSAPIVFFLKTLKIVIDGMIQLKDQNAFNKEFIQYGSFLKPEEVLTHFLDESFVIGR